MEERIIQRLEQIEKQLMQKNLLSKRIFNMEEASIYSGMSKSTLYKLTMARKIPHYKPSGKLVYILRENLEAFILTNRQLTDGEIQNQVQQCRKGGLNA